MVAETLVERRWYQTWWGVALLAGGGFLVLAALFLAGMTARYWWQLKHGETPFVPGELSGSFTAYGKLATTPGSVDRAVLETFASPYLGQLDAPVTIVEFVDFKCPNCKAAGPIMHQVAQKFGTKVKIIVRAFPAESIHPGATELSEVAQCAHTQGKFWLMHDVLLDSQAILPEKLTPEFFAILAGRAGVDLVALQDCLARPATAGVVRADFLTGVTAGVRGTPTFFVNGEKVEGVVPFASWEKYLKQF